MVKHNQKITIITGMNRSGIGLAANLFATETCGSIPVISSCKEYQQNIAEFQRELIESRGIGFLAKDMAQLSSFSDDELVQANSLVQRLRQTQNAGWTSPLTALTLNLWHELLEEKAFFVLVYRHPLEAIASIIRNGIFEEVSIEPYLGLQVWGAYNQILLDFYKQHPNKCILINASSIVNDLSGTLSAISKKGGSPVEVAALKSMVDKNKLTEINIGTQTAEILQLIAAGEVNLFHRLEEAADTHSTNNPNQKRNKENCSELLKCTKDLEKAGLLRTAEKKHIFSLLLAKRTPEIIFSIQNQLKSKAADQNKLSKILERRDSAEFGQTDSLSHELQQLKASESKLRKKVEVYQAHLAEQSSQIAAQKTQLKDALLDHKQLVKSRNDLQAERQAINSTLAEKSLTISTLEDKLLAVQINCEKATEEQTRLLSEIEELRSTITKFETENKKLAAQNNNLLNQISKLQHEKTTVFLGKIESELLVEKLKEEAYVAQEELYLEKGVNKELLQEKADLEQSLAQNQKQLQLVTEITKFQENKIFNLEQLNLNQSAFINSMEGQEIKFNRELSQAKKELDHSSTKTHDLFVQINLKDQYINWLESELEKFKHSTSIRIGMKFQPIKNLLVSN